MRQGCADVAGERVAAGEPEAFDLVGEHQETPCGGSQVGSVVVQQAFRPPSELRKLLLVQPFVHARWSLVRSSCGGRMAEPKSPARIGAV